LPKRSVTALDNENGQKRDLDARRTTTIKIIRSKSNNNKKDTVSRLSNLQLPLLKKREIQAPQLTPWGFFLAADLRPHFALLPLSE
jgi:hypothetical protein